MNKARTEGANWYKIGRIGCGLVDWIKIGEIGSRLVDWYKIGRIGVRLVDWFKIGTRLVQGGENGTKQEQSRRDKARSECAQCRFVYASDVSSGVSGVSSSGVAIIARIAATFVLFARHSQRAFLRDIKSLSIISGNDAFFATCARRRRRATRGSIFNSRARFATVKRLIVFDIVCTSCYDAFCVFAFCVDTLYIMQVETFFNARGAFNLEI